MIVSLLSGLLSGITLPTAIGGHHLPNLGGFVWISLVPLYLALKNASPWSAFKKSFVFGVGYYGVSFYWVFITLHTYGEVSAISSVLGVIVLVVILAAFSGALSLVATFAHRRGGPLALCLAFSWVAFDYLRNYIPFGGFPWSSLAYTQRSFLTLLQVLDVTGIYGITFLIVLFNGVLGEVWLWIFKRRRSFPSLGAASCAVLFLAALLYGHFRLGQIRHDLVARKTFRISLIQGNIPQEEKWLEELVEEIIAFHLTMSKEAENKIKPDLIIWPEAAYTAAVPPDVKSIDPVNELQTPLLMGAVTYEGEIPEDWPPIYNTQTFFLYNDAFLVRPGGEIAAKYSKTKLVPMGEYVPLGKLLFFLSRVVPSVSNFTPGKGLGLMELGQDAFRRRFGITICYEDLFPEISRALTQKGADFLVNLTNDAWYDRSSAVFQHFDFSRYRAIENRRSLARATNTGVTGFFSPTGEVMAQAPVFEEAIVSMDIPLGGVASFYTQYGDIFAWGCLLGLSLLMLPWVSRRGN